MYRTIPTLDDVEYILDNLREEDLIEATETHKENWRQEIINELLKHQNEYIIAKSKKDKKPVLMAGAFNQDKTMPYSAVVWMLSTPEIAKHQKTFIKEMKKEIEKYDEKYSLLCNRIYKSNHIAKKWLKLVGFKFINDNENKDFQIFYRIRPTKGLERI